jgi:hypothetical protein
MRLSSVNSKLPVAGSGGVRPVVRTGFTIASRKRSAFIVSRAASGAVVVATADRSLRSPICRLR